MTEQSGSADGRSLTTNLKDLGNVVKDDYRGRGGEAPHRDEIKAQYNDVKSTVGDQAGQLKEEAKNRAPDAQELKGRAKEEADARTGGQASGYQQKAVDVRPRRRLHCCPCYAAAPPGLVLFLKQCLCMSRSQGRLQAGCWHGLALPLLSAEYTAHTCKPSD